MLTTWGWPKYELYVTARAFRADPLFFSCEGQQLLFHVKLSTFGLTAKVRLSVQYYMYIYIYVYIYEQLNKPRRHKLAIYMSAEKALARVHRAPSCPRASNGHCRCADCSILQKLRAST